MDEPNRGYFTMIEYLQVLTNEEESKRDIYLCILALKALSTCSTRFACVTEDRNLWLLFSQ